MYRASVRVVVFILSWEWKHVQFSKPSSLFLFLNLLDAGLSLNLNYSEVKSRFIIYNFSAGNVIRVAGVLMSASYRLGGVRVEDIWSCHFVCRQLWR
jgi:hypothetical protein